MDKKTIQVALKLKDDLSRGLRTAATKARASTNKISAGAKKITTSFKAAMLSVKGLVAAFLALAALRQVFIWMKETIRLASEQEKAINKLNSALAATGKYSKESSKELQQFAKDMQAVTTVGDEVTLSMIGTLATLTELDEEGLKKAAQSTIGIAKVMKMDLNNAALVVGKSIGSQTNALIRYGIQLDTQATQQEKATQLMENTASMFEVAKAETDTYAGAVEQLGNAFGDWREKIGGVITENEAVKVLLKDITGMFSDTVDNMESDTTRLAETVKDIILAMLSAAKSAVWVMSQLQESFGFWAEIGARKQLESTKTQLQRAKEIQGMIAADESARGFMGVTKDLGLLGISPGLGKKAVDAALNAVITSLTQEMGQQKRRVEFFGEMQYGGMGGTSLEQQIQDMYDKVFATDVSGVSKLANSTGNLTRATGDLADTIDGLNASFKTFAELQDYLSQKTLPTAPFFKPNQEGKFEIIFPPSYGDELNLYPPPRIDMPKGFQVSGYQGHGSVGAQFSDYIQSVRDSFDDDKSFSQAQAWQMTGLQFIQAAQSGNAGQGIGGAVGGGLGLILSGGNPIVSQLGSMAGSAIGGLFGKKRRGSTPSEPVYTMDVNLHNSMTELLNAVKSNLAMSAGGGINRISGQLKAQATAGGYV